MRRKINPLPLLIIVFAVLALNWLVLSGIYVLSAAFWVAPVFWAISGGITAALIIAIIRTRSATDLYFKVASHAFLILFVAELVFAAILLTGDTYRLIAGGPRSIYWTGFAAALSGLTILVFLYGITRGKYAYRVIRHTLYFEDLPAAFDGFTITQISDIHAGSFANQAAVQKGIDLVNKQRSDLFVFTGDLVNNKADEIRPWLAHFRQIKAPYGQFSVLGNHDYGDYIKWPDEQSKKNNLQQLKQYHAELGFRLLLDEHIGLHKDGQHIVLAGVENWGIGFGKRGDLKQALNGAGPRDFKILLSHDPTHWQEEVLRFPDKINLTLSGHTHGMQFGIEALGIKWSPVKYRYPHWAGITGNDGTYLNINRGFGFLGFSGRVGIWPEITVIELRKKAY